MVRFMIFAIFFLCVIVQMGNAYRDGKTFNTHTGKVETAGK